MMNELDVVALVTDLPDKKLRKGQVGTIIEIISDGVFEVEFVDRHGNTYAMLTLQHDQIMLLHYDPIDKAG